MVPSLRAAALGEGRDVDDKSLYAVILGVKEPWSVEKVELRLAQGGGAHLGGVAEGDPVGLPRVSCRRVDPRPPRARLAPPGHLSVPDARACPGAAAGVPHPRHAAGARALGRGGRAVTALFEALAIDWMKQAAIATVAERLQLSWESASDTRSISISVGSTSTLSRSPHAHEFSHPKPGRAGKRSRRCKDDAEEIRLPEYSRRTTARW
jgi:hypothetical protein